MKSNLPVKKWFILCRIRKNLEKTRSLKYLNMLTGLSSFITNKNEDSFEIQDIFFEMVTEKCNRNSIFLWNTNWSYWFHLVTTTSRYLICAALRRSSKSVFLKISQYSQENTWRPVTLIKRDSRTVFFLWILRNFQEELFKRIPPAAAFTDITEIYF